MVDPYAFDLFLMDSLDKSKTPKYLEKKNF